MNMHRMKDESFAALLLLASMLGVSDAGELFISQEVMTKVKNESYFVLCRDDGGSAVTWRGPKGILGPKTRPEVARRSSGTSIIFKQLVKEDAGTYTCSTESGQKKDFHLYVTDPLKFKDTSANQSGIEGQPFTLRCEVQGGKVTWSVEGDDITDKERFTVGGDGLMIKKLNRTDSKTYICKAVQQSTGMVEDRKINLRVKHKPTFPRPTYAKQELTWGYLNGTANLTCVVVADPPATFEWKKNKDSKQKIGKIINESAEVSILQLHIKDNSTFGDYKCIAKNAYGILEKRFTLERGVQPTAPEIVEQKVNANFVELQIREVDVKDVGPAMEPTGFSVQYKRKDDSNWEVREFNITKDNVYHLDNLTHDTEYEAKVATRNAAGLSGYSDIFLFQTLTLPPDGDISPSPSLYSVGVVMAAIFAMNYLAFW